MRALLLSLIIFFTAVSSFGQHVEHEFHPAPSKEYKVIDHGTHKSIRIDPIICYPGEFAHPSRLPSALTQRVSQNSRTKELGIFVVDYGAGFPTDAQVALEYALSLWEEIIDSRTQIVVSALWEAREEGALASAGPSEIDFDFPNSPHPNRLYPIALAEKYANKSLNGDEADIIIRFNLNTDWYFGTDQQPGSSQFDFVTVALHEICHGLGFLAGSAYSESTNIGTLNPTIFAEYMVLQPQSNKPLLEFINPSTLMGDILTGKEGPVLFLSEKANALLYTPSEYNGGSSVSHLDLDKFQGKPEGLMSPSIGPGETLHSTGLGGLIMQDIGWKANFIDHIPVPSSEDFDQDIDILAGSFSDYGMDTSTFVLHYSSDSFKTVDTVLPMVFTGSGNDFKATIPNPSAPATFAYYITYTDVDGRIANSPPEGVEQPYLIIAGPDELAPEIVHTPADFVLESEPELLISAEITDIFTGVKSATIEYNINGTPQTSIPMEGKDFNIYEASIPIKDVLVGGDILSYRIVATDSATTENTGLDPVDSFHEVVIEGGQEAVEAYENDFNEPSDDFLGSSFEIIQVNGFDDPAIHSQHPYEEALDQFELNFTYQLKIPIIISSENPFMLFDEVVLIEPSEPGASFGDEGFWDYVIVEGSKDEGVTWSPFSNGIDSRANAAWLTRYNSGLDPETNISSALGDKGLFVERKIDLTESILFNAGDEVLIRFRLFSDQLAAGWGWAIDNLRIQSEIVVGLEDELEENSKLRIYPNPSSRGFYQISADLKAREANGTLVVRNILGREILEKEFTVEGGQLNESIDLRDQPAGVYLITTILNGENATYKVIKSE